MLHAGAIRLINAGVDIPCLLKGDQQRVALEAYPGLLARSVTRASYKSDTRAKQTWQRQRERERIVSALQNGECQPAVPVVLSQQQRNVLIEDASADALDAVLCLVQAAWAVSQGDGRYGLPENVDPLEGWIVGADAGNRAQ